MAQSDSQTGTPVTLVVQPGAGAPPPPGTRGHLPFSGFDLLPVVLLAVLVVVAGSALLVWTRLLPARPGRVHARAADSRRTP